jgi:hypothetical protein
MSDSGEREDGVKHLATGNWLDADPNGLRNDRVAPVQTAQRRPG